MNKQLEIIKILMLGAILALLAVNIFMPKKETRYSSYFNSKGLMIITDQEQGIVKTYLIGDTIPGFTVNFNSN